MPTRGPTSTTAPSSQFNYTPLIIGGIIIAAVAFVLGMLISKVQYLENQNKNTAAQTAPAAAGGTQPTAAPAITSADIKKWAKIIGLDTNKFNSCFDQNKYKDAIDKDTAEGQTAGVSGTPSFFINGALIVGALPYASIKDSLEKALNGTNGTVQVDNGHLPVFGKNDAKVTLIEFSDFECPFCRSFYKETEGQIKKDYIDNGKVKMYYRHYPLPFHPSAMPFANASECANEQGKFWEMHDKIFSSQS